MWHYSFLLRSQTVQCSTMLQVPLCSLPSTLKPSHPHRFHSWVPGIRFQCSRICVGSSLRGSGRRGHRARCCSAGGSHVCRRHWRLLHSAAQPDAASPGSGRQQTCPACSPRNPNVEMLSTPRGAEDEPCFPLGDHQGTSHYPGPGSHCLRWWRRACCGRSPRWSLEEERRGHEKNSLMRESVA